MSEKKEKEDFDNLLKTQRLNRLNFLLTRAGAYSTSNEIQELCKVEEKKKEVNSTTISSDPQIAKSTPERRVTRRSTPLTSNSRQSQAASTRKRKQQVEIQGQPGDLTEQSPTDHSSTKKKKNFKKSAVILPTLSEELEELNEIKKNREKIGEDIQNTPKDGSDRQPKLVTGAVMRDYQLVGLEWLIGLYDNGLNGILGDEMGLGKTLQTIAFLAFLREQGVWGPFLVVAPLSTLSNWVNEFNRFTPTIPVVLYHGTPEERAHIRNFKLIKLDETFPIVITSYEVCMNDRK
ncbi:hypothetical protein HK096_007004, partial [Nowakowskiella sp. JEL0078]